MNPHRMHTLIIPLTGFGLSAPVGRQGVTHPVAYGKVRLFQEDQSAVLGLILEAALSAFFAAFSACLTTLSVFLVAFAAFLPSFADFFSSFFTLRALILDSPFSVTANASNGSYLVTKAVIQFHIITICG